MEKTTDAKSSMPTYPDIFSTYFSPPPKLIHLGLAIDPTLQHMSTSDLRIILDNLSEQEVFIHQLQQKVKRAHFFHPDNYGTYEQRGREKIRRDP